MDRKVELISATPVLPSTRFADSPSTNLPDGKVRFRWFKSGPLAENLSPDFNVAKVRLQAERTTTRPMICGESGSRVATGSNVNGWKFLKAGMDHVFGRSIVPATVHKNLDDLAVNASMSHYLSEYSPRRNDSVDNAARHCNNNVNHYSNTKKQFPDVLMSPEKHKSDSKPAFVQHNAIAGALAGTCVSLCLHPIDTVKTVIQAKSFGQRSLFHTAFNITSDKGFFGLYRGLASNLASSAPISAIYTFTYETVKAALLPHLPKEYHAIAHCTAGGFASIATSIVYTPSECVKQQMQVGSLYRNSWQAFLGILKSGGLSVLYSGWKAVLCRNVPQSIIKFYTYEGLKHYACDGNPNQALLNTWQTLLFGGIAGSTAALFTTPFDVIKTRLQTQAAGSILHQNGILNAFRCIITTEGMNGLYSMRYGIAGGNELKCNIIAQPSQTSNLLCNEGGLIPRLIIYMSQGAIFFTSYEFFKHLLVMEVKRSKFDAGHPSIGHEDVIGST